MRNAPEAWIDWFRICAWRKQFDLDKTSSKRHQSHHEPSWHVRLACSTRVDKCCASGQVHFDHLSQISSCPFVLCNRIVTVPFVIEKVHFVSKPSRSLNSCSHVVRVRRSTGTSANFNDKSGTFEVVDLVTLYFVVFTSPPVKCSSAPTVQTIFCFSDTVFCSLELYDRTVSKHCSSR